MWVSESIFLCERIVLLAYLTPFDSSTILGIPTASDMEFTFSYIPLIFTEKKIAGSIVTGTRRMSRMLQMTKDELKTYANDSSEWNAKIVKFDQINEVMDDLLHGRNTNNWRYVFTW